MAQLYHEGPILGCAQLPCAGGGVWRCWLRMLYAIARRCPTRAAAWGGLLRGRGLRQVQFGYHAVIRQPTDQPPIRRAEAHLPCRRAGEPVRLRGANPLRQMVNFTQAINRRWDTFHTRFELERKELRVVTRLVQIPAVEP